MFLLHFPLYRLSFYLTLWHMWEELLSFSSFAFTIKEQWVPGHSLFPGNDTIDALAWTYALFLPSNVACSLFPLTSRIRSFYFLDLKHTVASEFVDTKFPTASAEKLVLLCNARCVLSRIRCNQCSFLFNSISIIGGIENPSYRACGLRTQDTPHAFLQRHVTESAPFFFLRLPFSLRSLIYGLGELPRFWDSMVSRHATVCSKGIG